MKKLYIIFFCFFLFNASVEFSQINITQNDYSTLFAVGKTNITFVDTLTETINIGQPGGNNQWDFTHLTPHTFLELTSVLTSTTPYADSFANSDVATYLNFELDSDSSLSGISETWSFYNSSNATEIGSVSYNSFTDNGITTINEIISRNIPPFRQYDFPLTFDKIWTVKDSVESKSYSSGELYMTNIDVTIYNIHIDAWGAMKLPSGKVVEALRARQQEISTTYFFGIPLGTEISVTYFFMAKTGESLSVLADSEDPSTSGVIIGSIGWSNDEKITDVQKFKTISNKFSLNQNYPNQFNPTTKIEYNISENSYVKLIIYDILGNEVSQLVNKYQSAGKYSYLFDGSKLASGTYFVHLYSGNYIETIKMSLLK